MNNTQITAIRKRIVFRSQKGRDNYILLLKAFGWRVIMTQICYQAKNKKVYIVELERDK